MPAIGSLAPLLPSAPAVRRCLLALALLAIMIGCTAAPKDQDITTIVGSHTALATQSTPTEIQAAVMSFSDKYTSRAAHAFDMVHDRATSAEVRRIARQAKLNLGLSALTIACEVNPVASLLDMVALARLQRRSFADHWASSLPQDDARVIQAMLELGEHDAWELAGRFLTDGQLEQLRALIDAWYRQNPESRYTSHVRLIDFAAFRREPAPVTADTPASVLALLRIDPMAGMDPVAREFQESRLMAERALFFAARLSPLLSWQAQRMTADLLAKPEAQTLLTSAGQMRQAADRLPVEVDELIARSTERFQALIAAERDAAIRQADAAVTAQRQALLSDIDAREQTIRDLLAEVRQTLAQAGAITSSAGTSADQAIQSAQQSATDVIDHAHRRALALLLIALLAIPAALLAYHFLPARMNSSRRAPSSSRLTGRL